MAQQRNSRSRQRRQPAKPAKTFSFPKRKQPEFKPDKQGTTWFKTLNVTQSQRDKALKWGLVVALLLFLLVLQDVIMSQVRIFGTTTDLVASAILLITVMEGIQSGSMFVLIASTLFYFSGSAPGPYAVALLTVLGIGACMFRQLYWHRNRGSIVLCAGIALMLYEIMTYGICIFNGLTYWGRIHVFVTKGLLSWAVMLPLYPLIHAIGQIGGNTWKE